MALTTSGLVAYYNSKQGISGTTWSNIAPGATGLHLTLSGGADTSGAATVGVLFDGTSGRAESADSYTTATQFTLEAWINQTVAATAGIFGFYSSDTLRGYIGTNSSSDYFTYVDQAGSNRATTGTTTKPSTLMATNVHFVMRYDGSAITNWINGVQLGSSAVTPAGLQGIPTMGSRKLAAGPSNYFKGYIMVARSYNRALTNTEIGDNYAFGTAVGLSSGTTYSVTGNSDGVSTASSSPVMVRSVTGTAAGTSTASANVTFTQASAGSAAGASTASATPVLVYNTSGTASGVSTVVGVPASGPNIYSVTGTASGTGAVTGVPTTFYNSMTGSITATSSVTYTNTLYDKINLIGERLLNINLSAERALNVNLNGERLLNLSLRGEI